MKDNPGTKKEGSLADALIDEVLRLAKGLNEKEASRRLPAVQLSSPAGATGLSQEGKTNSSSQMLLPSEIKEKWESLLSEAFLDAFSSEVLEDYRLFIPLANSLIQRTWEFARSERSKIVEAVIQALTDSPTAKLAQEVELVLLPVFRAHCQDLFSNAGAKTKLSSELSDCVHQTSIDSQEDIEELDEIASLLLDLCVCFQLQEKKVTIPDASEKLSNSHQCEIFTSFEKGRHHIIDGFFPKTVPEHLKIEITTREGVDSPSEVIHLQPCAVALCAPVVDGKFLFDPKLMTGVLVVPEVFQEGQASLQIRDHLQASIRMDRLAKKLKEEERQAMFGGEDSHHLPSFGPKRTASIGQAKPPSSFPSAFKGKADQIAGGASSSSEREQLRFKIERILQDYRRPMSLEVLGNLADVGISSREQQESHLLEEIAIMKCRSSGQQACVLDLSTGDQAFGSIIRPKLPSARITSELHNFDRAPHGSSSQIVSPVKKPSGALSTPYYFDKQRLANSNLKKTDLQIAVPSSHLVQAKTTKSTKKLAKAKRLTSPKPPLVKYIKYSNSSKSIKRAGTLATQQAYGGEESMKILTSSQASSRAALVKGRDSSKIKSKRVGPVVAQILKNAHEAKGSKLRPTRQGVHPSLAGSHASKRMMVNGSQQDKMNPPTLKIDLTNSGKKRKGGNLHPTELKQDASSKRHFDLLIKKQLGEGGAVKSRAAKVSATTSNRQKKEKNFDIKSFISELTSSIKFTKPAPMQEEESSGGSGHISDNLERAGEDPPVIDLGDETWLNQIRARDMARMTESGSQLNKSTTGGQFHSSPPRISNQFMVPMNHSSQGIASQGTSLSLLEIEKKFRKLAEK